MRLSCLNIYNTLELKLKLNRTKNMKACKLYPYKFTKSNKTRMLSNLNSNRLKLKRIVNQYDVKTYFKQP